MQTNARLALQLSAAVVVAIAAFLLPLFKQTNVRGPLTMNLSNARQLATACKLYAMDHNGRFPMHLSELEPDNMAPGTLVELRYVTLGQDRDPKYRMDWLYFGAGFNEQNAPTVLIASPQASTTGKEQKRVVIQGDTAGVVIKEDKYQKMLAETVKQMRALDDAQHPAKAAPVDALPKDAPQ